MTNSRGHQTKPKKAGKLPDMSIYQEQRHVNSTLDKPTRGSREKMLAVNVRQKDFYESRFEATQVSRLKEERAANWITNVWSRMRVKLVDMRRMAGLDEQIHRLHTAWLGDLTGARVLDLGCFEGNHLSLWMAENCADYTGMDLSEQAIGILNARLQARGIPHARGCAEDFLANSYPDNSFDVVYAYSVLHHFKDRRVLMEELNRVLKPGGVIIAFDPMMTEPLNRIARALYRPFQSDRAWEWPFTRATFKLFEQHFEIADMQGCLGMVKLGFPFQMASRSERLGRRIALWGAKFDGRHANRLGPSFYFCWQVTLRLRKPLKP